MLVPKQLHKVTDECFPVSKSWMNCRVESSIPREFRSDKHENGLWSGRVLRKGLGVSTVQKKKKRDNIERRLKTWMKELHGKRRGACKMEAYSFLNSTYQYCVPWGGGGSSVLAASPPRQLASLTMEA